MADPVPEDPAAEIDRCLGVIGLGWCNIRYYISLILVLIASTIELVGNSMVLPAAKCDLNMSDAQRGIIASIPQFGIFITSHIHGYLVDTRGRRNIIFCCCLTTGSLGVLTALMPEIISFSIFKFLTSLCIGVPSAVPYTFIGEILPRKNRDLLLALCNAAQITGSTLVPLLAWAIIPLNFRLNIGLYVFRPWRLLSMLYSCLLLMAGALVYTIHESPKFLLSRGDKDSALKILQSMYAENKRKTPDDFPVKDLSTPVTANEGQVNMLASVKRQTLPLMKWVYIRYLMLNGVLLFGIYSVLNGLYMWVPDVLNRVLSGSQHGKTACQVIMSRFQNENKLNKCTDTMDTVTYVVNTIAQIVCAVLSFGITLVVKFFGKRILLLVVFFTMGTICLLINHITRDEVFAVLLSSIPILALGIGAVNAYSVEIFPTHLRGMGMCLCMMVGRLGSVFGNNVAGVLINVACEDMFYVFGFILIACGALSLMHK